MRKDVASLVGPACCGTLTAVFVVLKLTGVIDWGWAWVLVPLWAPLAVAMVIIVVFGVVFGLLEMYCMVTSRCD